MMGGVSTNARGETTIPGLFAAGEAACVSIHGANRLGGNSLLETLVFGKEAGLAAAAYVATAATPVLGESDLERETAHVRAMRGSERRGGPAGAPDPRCSRRWTTWSASTGTPRSSPGAAGDPAAQGAVPVGPDRGPVQGLQPQPHRRPGDRPHARAGRGDHRRGDRPDREPRRPHPRRLPEAGRCELDEAHPRDAGPGRPERSPMHRSPTPGGSRRSGSTDGIGRARASPADSTSTGPTRRTDAAPRYQRFELDLTPHTPVLTALLKIREHGPLADPAILLPERHLRFLRHGGQLEERLACQTPIGPEIAAHGRIVIDPMRNLPVLRDLVVEMSPFWGHYGSCSPT